MKQIDLTYINKSEESDNISVIILQKNYAAAIDEFAVAWKVIKNCGYGMYHPFSYSLDLELNAVDSYGNHMSRVTAEPGQQFQVANFGRSTLLRYKGPAWSPVEIELANNLPKGAISANVYRSGQLVVTKTSMPPGQKAVFVLKPIIFIGTVSQVVREGEIITSAVISQANTELSLTGIKSASIVMTGGGSGPNSTPYKFDLQDIVST